MIELIAHRTRVYVDGYNLYYGCLKGTGYKWLDLRRLFELILRSVLLEAGGAPVHFEWLPLAVKYFTAPILKNFAREEDSVASQALYHHALRGHLEDQIEIIQGYYDAKPARAHLFEKGKPARACEKREIWKIEEKESDVALALHAYSDAARGEVDHVVIVTNDTDIVPAMRMIRSHTQATIGLIVPADEGTRRVNADLKRLAHWTRAHVVDAELALAQLPNMVRYRQQIIHKPISWYSRPDLLVPILVEARRVRKSKGAAWKWLNQPCAHLNDRVPVDMVDNDDDAAVLRAYMDRYARDFGL
jgi:6-hydroxy-3-succinoylpyridine 3-monooxygenase